MYSGGIPYPVGADEVGYKFVSRLFQDHFRRIKLKDVTAFHNADSVCNLDSLVHIVGNKDHGLPYLRLQFDQLILQAAPGYRVQALRRVRPKRIISGSLARALMTPILCLCPPESSVGYLSRN